jgi:hypothetical protein
LNSAGAIIDMQENLGRPSLNRDVIAGTARARSARSRHLRAGFAKFMGLLLAAFRIGGMRRKLISLSDRQLTDAGIDLTVAGRGKAAAARPDPNFEGSR